MQINLNEIETMVMKNYKQGEGEILSKIVIDGNRKLMHYTLKKDSSVGIHCHNSEYEIIYIINGKATIIKENETFLLGNNEFFVIKPNQNHSIINKDDEDLVLISIVYK